MWYTITKAEEKKRWSSKHGDFITYDIAVLGDDGVPCPSCMLNQKDSTPAPMVDQRLHGYIEDTDFGLKFNKTQAPEGDYGSSGQSPHAGASQPSTGQSNGDTQNQIIRQSSLKVAADLCIANMRAYTDRAPEPVKVDEVISLAEQLAKWAETGLRDTSPEPMSEIDAHIAAMAESEKLPFDALPSEGRA